MSTAAASDSATTEPERGSLYVIVKQEFLIPVATKAATGATTKGAGEDGEVGKKRATDSRDAREQYQPGTTGVKLKNRHQDNRPEKADRLCTFTTRGEPCKFAGECPYLHDTKVYLANKPADIGPVCYQYETFGFCPNGLMCRYGSSHINYETGENMKRKDEDGGVIERTHINVLKKELQIVLRKKQYGRRDDLNSSGQKVNTKLKIVFTDDIKPAPAASSSSDAAGSSAPAPALAPIPPAPPVLSSSAAVVSHVAVAAAVGEKPLNFSSYPDKEVKLIDFSNKVYVAPLTTVGNLPFRRIMKEYGADITCGEMAMANNIENGQASEWALLRRHQSEDCFGVQVAGGQSDMMSRVSRIIDNEVSSDFADLNCGCPIDVLCNKGSGAALLLQHKKLNDIMKCMTRNLKTRSLTIKVRTGWEEKKPTTHNLIPMLQQNANNKVSAIMIHGRSRLQRYHKLSDWEYVLSAAKTQDPSLPLIPVIGNGDLFGWDDWRERQALVNTNIDDGEVRGLCSCAMLARGALIKPWLPTEIHERRTIDIPASERLEIVKKFW